MGSIVPHAFLYGVPVIILMHMILMVFIQMCLLEVALCRKFIFNFYSRRREYNADEFALRTTGLVAAFKDSQIRLVNTTYSLATAKRSNSTHPSLANRLKHADEFAKKQAERLRADPAKR